MSKDAWKRFGDKKTKKIDYNYYDVKKIGYKYNMTDIMASMGIVQLKKINYMWKKRKQIYDFYQNELKHLPLKFQKNNKYKIKHGYHLFIMIINNNISRENLLNYLNKKGIGATVHYNDLTEFTAYKNIFRKKVNIPISKYVCKNIISLPIYPDLKKTEMRYITNTLKFFFKKNA